MPLSLGDRYAETLEPMMPPAYWGGRQIWDTRVSNHNMMVDRKGRVWLTASVRALDNPASRCSRCSSIKLSAGEASFSAEILGRRRSRGQNNSGNSRCYSLFPAVFVLFD